MAKYGLEFISDDDLFKHIEETVKNTVLILILRN